MNTELFGVPVSVSTRLCMIYTHGLHLRVSARTTYAYLQPPSISSRPRLAGTTRICQTRQLGAFTLFTSQNATSFSYADPAPVHREWPSQPDIRGKERMRRTYPGRSSLRPQTSRSLSRIFGQRAVQIGRHDYRLTKLLENDSRSSAWMVLALRQDRPAQLEAGRG